MRFCILLGGLALLGPVSLTAQDVSREADQAKLENLPTQTLNGMPDHRIDTGKLVNPDHRCADQFVVASGREGEAQFLRRPSEHTPPPLYLAVDLAVDGCDVLLTSEGIRQLPEVLNEAKIHPAQ
jgi:hypothetical protein